MGKWRSTYQGMLRSRQSLYRSKLLSNLVGSSPNSDTNLAGLVEPLVPDSSYSSPQSPASGLDGEPSATKAKTPKQESTQQVLSVPQVVFNIVNIILGAGVLSMPYAFKRSGYVTIAAMGAVIYITSTTGKWLAAALEMAASIPDARGVPASAMDYGFLAKMAFGDRGLLVVGWVTILEIWLASVTFLVMTAANVTAICPHCDQHYTVPVAAFGTMLLCFVPPKIFSYLSLLSTLSMVLALAALVGAALSIGVQNWEMPRGEQAYIDPWNLPRSIGIITFCFAGHPVFPSVHSSMKMRTKWNASVDISFAAAFAYYGIFGFLGYLVFGRDVEPTITNNLERGCQALAAVCFLVKLNLTLPMMFSTLLVALSPPSSDSSTWRPKRVAVLFGVVGVTSLIALAFQNAVETVTSLAGNLFIMTTSVLFPPVAHLQLMRTCGREVHGWLAFQYVMVLAFGLIFGMIGTAFAISDMWDAPRAHGH